MNCLFCKIVRKEIPANIVFENDHVLAFRDINPTAPVHVLVIPKDHISGLQAASAEHEALLGRVMLGAQAVAKLEGILDSGFRTVINAGPDANQTVAHLHAHVIGKRMMQWPPG